MLCSIYFIDLMRNFCWTTESIHCTSIVYLIHVHVYIDGVRVSSQIQRLNLIQGQVSSKSYKFAELTKKYLSVIR